MKRIISALICYFLCLLPGHAQDLQGIQGQVFDQAENPISFATIIAYTTTDSSIAKTAFSDEQGKFILAPLTSGEYWIRVSFAEYEPYKSETLSFTEGKMLRLPAIKLIEKEVSLDKVNIYAQKPLIEVKPDMTIFNVSGTINSIGENAFELLRKAPGVIIDNQDNLILMGKSGVNIYIDGKRSPLSIADLAVMLKGMQADQIESIEIITNPSARFEAEGNAGIINIRLKKDKSLGTQGSVGVGYGVGIFSRYNGSLNFNSRNKKMNVFGNYSGSLERNYGFTNFYRTQNGFILDQRNDMFGNRRSNNVKLGTDFFVGKKHTLGIMYSGFFSDNTSLTESLTPISLAATNEVQSILDAEVLGENENTSQTFNLNYTFKNKAGNTWNLDADYGRYRLETYSIQPNLFLSPADQQLIEERSFTINSPRDIDIYSFKADHKRKLWGGTFSTGAKLAYILTDNTFSYADLYENEEVLNESRSNNFVYKENINALYSIFQKRINQKWNWELGNGTEGRAYPNQWRTY